MASKLTKWINAQLKAKGKSSKEAQKDAGKYSSIAAAKKAGSLYYTDKKGRVMIAAYAEDLSKPLPKPKETKTKIVKPEKRPEAVKTKKKKTETKKIDTVAKKPNSKTPDESSGGKSKVTTITIKEDDGARAGRSEKEKEIDNMTKKLATLKIRKADRKATDKVKLREVREKIRKAQEKAASKDTNTQLRQMGALEMEAADRYRQPGQGSGRGLRGTQPEEFTKKVKYKPRKAKGGLIDMRKIGLFK